MAAEGFGWNDSSALGLGGTTNTDSEVSNSIINALGLGGTTNTDSEVSNSIIKCRKLNIFHAYSTKKKSKMPQTK
jgi:hypothetical protein